jgi:hypothetical protein
MSSKFVMFLAFVLVLSNILCLIIDGAWLGVEDQTLMQYMTGMNALQAASWTAIFTVPIGFITHGFPKMILWDFSFFSGALQIIRWILFVISIGAIWAMAQEFRNAAVSLFGRR